jgi:DNA-binding transcriptional LysR family regulator
MIENRLLRYALVLGERRNFARAAEALGLTQPTLSRSIAALERDLGVRLFERSHKGATPTVFGRVLLERGAIVLEREAEVRREIQLLAGLEAGSLTVSAGPYFAEGVVATSIARVAVAHPGLRIKCHSADPTEVVRNVLAAKADVGVATAPSQAEEPLLQMERLPPQRAYFACRPGHPLTHEDKPSIRRVLEFPLVTTRLRGMSAVLAATRGTGMPWSSPDGGDYEPPISVNTVALARRIALESDAIVPGTAATLAEDIAAGRLVAYDFDVPGMRIDGAAFYLRGRTLAPAARAFVEALHAVAKAKIGDAEATMAAAVRPATKTRRRAGSRR